MGPRSLTGVIARKPSVRSFMGKGGMYFALRGVSREALVRAEMVADLMHFDERTNAWVYRLNPVKAAKLGLSKALEILGKLGVNLGGEVLELLKSLETEKPDVYLLLEPPYIKLFATEQAIATLRKIGSIKIMEDQGALVVEAKNLHPLLRCLESNGLKYKLSFQLSYGLQTQAPRVPPLEGPLSEAYGLWTRNGCVGFVPTTSRAARALLALRAFEDLKVRALVLASTATLARWWFDVITEWGGEKLATLWLHGEDCRRHDKGCAVVVTTYAALARRYKTLSTHFGLLIADDCDRVNNINVVSALMGLTAPYRLGFSASLRISKLWQEAVGPLLLEMPLSLPRQLLGHYIRECRLHPNTTAPEHTVGRGRGGEGLYHSWSANLTRCPSTRISHLIGEKKARRRKTMRAIEGGLGPEEVMRLVEDLLKNLKGARALVASTCENLVRELSQRFLVPRIVRSTAREERDELLRLFRKGLIKVMGVALNPNNAPLLPGAPLVVLLGKVKPNLKRELLESCYLLGVRGVEVAVVEIAPTLRCRS